MRLQVRACWRPSGFWRLCTLAKIGRGMMEVAHVPGRAERQEVVAEQEQAWESPPRPRRRPAHRAAAGRPGTGPPGRCRGWPRPARPGARSPRRRPRGSRPRRGARNRGRVPGSRISAERRRAGRTPRAGGRRRASRRRRRASPGRRPDPRVRRLRGEQPRSRASPHQEHGREGGEEPGRAQRHPVVGGPVGHGRDVPADGEAGPATSRARA